VRRQDSNRRYGRIFRVKRFLALGLAVFVSTPVALAGKAEPPVIMDAWPALLTACTRLTTAAHNQHVTFESGARRMLLNGLFDINATGKANAAVNGPQSLRIAGQQVKLYRVAPGMSGYADHAAIVWTVNQQTYMVTVHRWNSDALAKVQAVAMTKALLREIA
jgi:hypothetical protein